MKLVVVHFISCSVSGCALRGNGGWVGVWGGWVGRMGKACVMHFISSSISGRALLGRGRGRRKEG